MYRIDANSSIEKINNLLSYEGELDFDYEGVIDDIVLVSAARENYVIEAPFFDKSSFDNFIIDKRLEAEIEQRLNWGKYLSVFECYGSYGEPYHVGIEYDGGSYDKDSVIKVYFVESYEVIETKWKRVG